MVALAKDALAGWRALEAESGRVILHQAGLFLFPGAFAERSYATLLDMGEPIHRIDELPAFASGGVVDPTAGWLDPREALPALAGGAHIERGAVARIGSGKVRLMDGRDITARRIVVAAGFHAPELLHELRGRIRVTRQVELFFGADDEPTHPVFADLDGGFYGFPPREGAVKVADHRKGPVMRDLAHRPPPTDAEVGSARMWMRDHLPRHAEGPLARWRVCLYDNAPEDKFVLEWSREHEGVFIAAGMSGHAFKFGPALGERIASMTM